MYSKWSNKCVRFNRFGLDVPLLFRDHARFYVLIRECTDYASYLNDVWFLQSVAIHKKGFCT